MIGPQVARGFALCSGKIVVHTSNEVVVSRMENPTRNNTFLEWRFTFPIKRDTFYCLGLVTNPSVDMMVQVLQMNQLSLRNNQLKFKISREFLILLEESI